MTDPKIRVVYEGAVKFWYVPKDKPDAGRWVHGEAKLMPDDTYVITWEGGGQTIMDMANTAVNAMFTPQGFSIGYKSIEE